jgi:hypothetical protein
MKEIKRIVISSKYVVDVDDYNYTLKEIGTSVNKKTGETEEKETTLGYYSTLQGVFKALHQRYIKNNLKKVTMLKEVREIVHNSLEELNELFKEVGE